MKYLFKSVLREQSQLYEHPREVIAISTTTGPR